MIDTQANVNTGGEQEKFIYQVDAVELSGEEESGQEGFTNAPSESQRCEFCHCSRTPLWRRGPQGKRTLCNACGIRWSSRAKEAKPPQNYLMNDGRDEDIDTYRLGRNGETVTFNTESNATFNPHEEEDGSTFMVREDGSDSSSVEDGPEGHPNATLAPQEGDDDGESHSSDVGHDANDGWEEGYDDKLPRHMMEEGDDDSDDAAHLNPEEAEDEGHSGVVKIEGGKEQYYCKYCDTSWPYNHFRNAQQFGAHCSNCSRKRKVKDPQELTIRERNKRLRKSKKPSGHPEKKKQRPPRQAASEQHDGMEFDEEASPYEGAVSDGEAFGNSAISVLQKAIASDKEWGPVKGRSKSKAKPKAAGDAAEEFLDPDSAGGAAATRGRRSRSNSRTKRKYDDFAEPAEDRASFLVEPDMPNAPSSPRSRRNSVSSRSNAEEWPKKSRGEHTHRKRSSSAKRRKPMVIITPDDELEQEAIISDPNSVGGLLAAIERKLTAEKKKRELSELKQRVWGMRKELGEEYSSRLEDLRFKSVALVQELRVDMVAKLEGLKLDLASELSFRETRRKKRLNEMRIQMNALNRILESGKKDRENGLLVSTFGGKFDTALKQLEELKMNLQKEFSSREQAMQQQFSEMRATCSLHLANIKQQIHEELNIREGRMQKDLEDMKHKLHSVCSQIGAENYCPESSLPHSPIGMPLSALPTAPEKFTTTTTTTTTTTITTNINTTTPLPILPAGMGLGVPLSPLTPVGLGRPMGLGGSVKVPTTLGKSTQLQQQQQQPSAGKGSPAAGLLPSFGALDLPGEVKSSSS